MPDYFSGISNPYALVKKVLKKYRFMPDFEDMVQECIIKCWYECNHNYNPQRGRLIPFAISKILAGAYNFRLSAARLSKRMGDFVVVTIDSDFFKDNLPDFKNDFFDALVKDIVISDFLDSIDNYKHRSVVSLYLNGYQFKDISKMVGLSETQCKRVYHKYTDNARLS